MICSIVKASLKRLYRVLKLQIYFLRKLMRKKNILLSMIGALFTMGGMSEITPPQEKKKPVYFSKKTKRTKGKRERSLKSRANRAKRKR